MSSDRHVTLLLQEDYVGLSQLVQSAAGGANHTIWFAHYPIVTITTNQRRLRELLKWVHGFMVLPHREWIPASTLMFRLSTGRQPCSSVAIFMSWEAMGGGCMADTEMAILSWN